jgi:FkbM family methyltransferase
MQRIAPITRRYPLRGSERLLRLLYSPFNRENAPIEAVIRYNKDMLINLDTASYIEWYIYFFGYYERYIINLMKRWLRQGGVAVDVGANVGCHTLIMSSLVGPAGRVLAFEPHPKIFERLADNLNLNRLANVKTFPYALADESGSANLYTFGEDYANQGMSSLTPVDGTEAQHSIPIECKTLDEVAESESLDRLDLIKIDTEGYEAKVIMGAKKSLASFRPSLLLEYNKAHWQRAGHTLEDVKSLLTDLGYELYFARRSGIIVKVKDSLPPAANILAVPHGRHFVDKQNETSS